MEKRKKEILFRIGEIKDPKPRNNDKEAKFKLFNNSRAFKAILTFLNSTKIGIKPDWEQEEEEITRNMDSWDIESIEGLDSEGMG